MNQAEFDALKPGDKVRNAQGHEATVADVGEYGVRVQWGGNGPLFTLYRQGRIWVTMDIVAALPQVTCDGCGTVFEDGYDCPKCVS